MNDSCAPDTAPGWASPLSFIRDLTDALVSDVDAVDFASLLLQGCLEYTEVREAGILIAAPGGQLEILASSSEATQALELLGVQADEGPCVEAYKTGRRVSCRDIPGARDRWPRFAAAAEGSGITEAHSLPIRLRNETVGALNVFVGTGTRLGADDIELLAILAGATALGILTHRRLEGQERLAVQLQGALDSRVVIEQAKGVLAAGTGMSPERSFQALRAQARHERRTLVDVAAEIVAGTGSAKRG